MKIYQSKLGKLSGSSYGELIKNARKIYHNIEKQTKRTPYIKSAYFKNQKIFVNLYFDHLNQKSILDRKRRLKYFECGIDLIKKSHFTPDIRQNPNNKSEKLYRFYGATIDNDLFYVQIKENQRGNKFYMSSFTPGRDIEEKPRK